MDIKWNEWWICCDAGISNSGYGTIDLAPDSDSESLHVIEAAPALAHIEELKKEIENLRVENKYYSGELSKLHRKFNELKKESDESKKEKEN